MLIALGCVTLLAVLLVFLLHQQSRAVQEERAQWVLERRELNERIQRPERVPASVTEEREFVIPDQVPDKWARIGEIDSIADDYGLADDS